MARMKTNVTLKLDAALLRELRVLAAEDNKSVTGLLTEQLESIIRERKGYNRAYRAWLEHMRNLPAFDYQTPMTRDEMHER